ncbi:hypothetical protein ACPCSG_19425 [Streptomyces cellulosae]
MQTSKFPSVRALDQLLDGLGAGAARRRQLDMVRGELERALDRGALPVPPGAACSGCWRKRRCARTCGSRSPGPFGPGG